MKIEALTQEQIEKIKALETDEERLDYLKECGVELDDDMLAEVAGGGPGKSMKNYNIYCTSGPNIRKPHKWVYTGKTRKAFLGLREYKEKNAYIAELLLQPLINPTVHLAVPFPPDVPSNQSA